MKKGLDTKVYPAALRPDQGGRNQMEWAADFKWNRWPESRGMGGRLQMESVAGLDWNTHQIAAMGSQSQQIAQAIDWLKGNFTQSLRIDDLATLVNMSTSTFHHHFRAVTAMSPLQYQKRLRLNEARQLMLIENQDAATAAFQVGYESPSQFSREYSRLLAHRL